MRAHRAFTLLEMLIALGVFAIIGVLSSRILLGMVDVSSATADHSATLAELQRAVSVVERDVEQLVRRSVRDEHGDPRDAVAVDDQALLELTRRGLAEPARCAARRAATCCVRAAQREAHTPLLADSRPRRRYRAPSCRYCSATWKTSNFSPTTTRIATIANGPCSGPTETRASTWRASKCSLSTRPLAASSD